MRNTIVARARAGAAILLVAPAAPGRRGLHARDHHGSRHKVADGTFDELASRADSCDGGLQQIFLRVTGHDSPACPMFSAHLYIILCAAREPAAARCAACASRGI